MFVFVNCFGKIVLLIIQITEGRTCVLNIIFRLIYMYHVSAQGADEHMVLVAGTGKLLNVHYYNIIIIINGLH